MRPDQPPRALNAIPVYNPDLLSSEELKTVFVARRELFDRVVVQLRRNDLQPTLFVGVRGMGKTTMLRRIALEVNENPLLFCEWLPLTFPEEQYNVSRLSDFYLNVLDALSDALERAGDTDSAIALDLFISELPEEESARAEAARSKLKSESERLKRRLLLLIDNLGQIAGNLNDADAWAFRHLLENEAWLLLVAATTGYAEFSQYDKPFYDFFRTEELRGLSPKEVRTVLEAFAESEGSDGVRKWLRADPGRLRAITALTGGNPRTTVLLYNLIKQGPTDGVRSDLERLLDLSTPLYKAIFEDLPQQQQLIVHEIALNWAPILAAHLADKVRLDVTTVSSQLSRLEKLGMIQKVAYTKTTRSAYQIGERFFNIWYLMRASRRIRRKLYWLVEFLRLFYTASELQEAAERHLLDPCPLSSTGHQRQAEMSLALAETFTDDLAMRRALEHHAIDSILHSPELRLQLPAIFSPEEDADLLSHADRKRVIEEILENIESAATLRLGIEKEELTELLLSPFSPIGTSLLIARRLGEVEQGALATLRAMAISSRGYLLAIFGETVKNEICNAVAKGELIGLEDHEGADSAEKLLRTRTLPAAIRAYMILHCKLDSNQRSALHKELDALLGSSGCTFAKAVSMAKDGVGEEVRQRNRLIAHEIVADPEASPVSLILAAAAIEPAPGEVHHRALDAAQRLVELCPCSPTYQVLARALTDMGRHLEAGRAFELASVTMFSSEKFIDNAADSYAAIQDIDLAISEIERLHSKYPEDPHVALIFAEMLITTGRLGRASELLESIQPSPKIDARLTIARKDLAKEMGNPEEALRLLRVAAEMPQVDRGVLAALVNECLSAKSLDEAVKVARRLSDLDTNSGPARALLALAMEAASDYDGAEEQFARAADASWPSGEPFIGLKPDLSGFMIAYVLCRSGRWGDAVRAVRRITQAALEDIDPAGWQMVITFATAAVKVDRAKEAQELLTTMQLSERWLPLAEALRTIVEGEDHLLTLAPEVREPTKEILAKLRIGPGVAVPRKKTGRKKAG